MIKIRARIKLFKSVYGRKTSFVSGYRPLFNFIEGMKTSGQITLIDRKEFYPDDEGLVEITFLNNNYLGNNFSKGIKFTFDEGREFLGEGEITEVLE
jgi:translation elongation factor EF-Tu-like GTPase